MPFKFNTITEEDILKSPGGLNMLSAIKYNGPRHMLVTGPPGSGKTTVTLMRATRQLLKEKSVRLLTYQHLLRYSLISIADPILKDHIHTIYRWLYDSFEIYAESHDKAEMVVRMEKSKLRVDEILIDEGQDLPKTIFEALPTIAARIAVGADSGQMFYEKGTQSEVIGKVLESHLDLMPIPLQFNYRNYFETYDFARQFMPPDARSTVLLEHMPKGKGGTDQRPIIIQTTDDDATLERIIDLMLDNEFVNVAILFYYPHEVDSWHRRIRARLEKDRPDLYVSRFHSDMSIYQRDKEAEKMQNFVITTYKYIKGLEFQVIIMPSMQYAMNKENIETPQHYYVACTRATQKLFLLYSTQEKPKWLIGFRPETYIHQVYKPL
ncbi:AAA family ATPase [Hymenobacter endophyticus]|uniref:DNA 3'-5' helicase II n=1 Tax=Hymenobacter endophyticus TaxID=3076335 RepID=A0ABU3TCK8_9BACT|nr:AAA family ATPase [Hymenobacter endophyticus]MDU0369103.1 AAA family ATPase [Hymenobacter endophyticus]